MTAPALDLDGLVRAAREARSLGMAVAKSPDVILQLVARVRELEREARKWWECESCGFAMDAAHSYEDGTYQCPACGDGKIAADEHALTFRQARELAESRAETAERVLEKAERERDEAIERCDALEDAVRESLPEVTADADGNLESNEICRIETVGYLFKQLERERDELAEALRGLCEAIPDLHHPRHASPLEWEMAHIADFARAKSALAKIGSNDHE